ncbi:FadR/GntR family transcriptional regulator [Actinomadura algeriensis]|uniref:DNA-binding FadR family transcriptional regulator n=1 Tax=Actinomadura algeriensis TaxID=1679523 RepID=A0ABR9JIJ2_9ACTN|nr:FCD domain-containing protein [Actinomadura algeriensis]MBE1530221.1 DNA-binding FadR family transcriptional regulator [Actinomadura algeriensis]
MVHYSERGLHGQTVQEIARRILTGELAPGDTIDVAALGDELDLSLTALREALKVLAAKGLVASRQKRGTFVRPRADWSLLDPDVIRWQFANRDDETFLENLAEVRGIIEPQAARLAARRRTADDLAALDAALRDMAGADGDIARAVQADLDFHRALLTATHNELLQRMEVVIEVGLAERDRLVHGVRRHDDPVPSHRAVLDAVHAEAPAEAERAMRDLLAKAARDLDTLDRDR